MKLDTRNLEHLVLLQTATKKHHYLSAITDQDSPIRISINKDAMANEMDSWLAADEIFDIKGQNGQAMLSEFEYITISDRFII
jgi:hypothetical protein